MVQVGGTAAGDFIRGSEILKFMGKEKKKVRVKIIGGGEYLPSKFKKKDGTSKTQLVIPVRMEGEIRKLGMNPTSIKAISLRYSAETENWINKHLDLEAEKKTIGRAKEGKETIVIWADPVEEDFIKDEDLF